MNLYDVAGNLWEWTTEAAYVDNLDYKNSSSNTLMLRGGGFHLVSTTYPTCFRAFNYALDTHTSHGFRPALFLQ